MFNLFKRKPRIIPFNAYRPPEPASPQVTPGNQCIFYSFKPCPIAGKPTGECKIISFEYRNFEYPGHCKLDFIWDHLS